MNRKIYIDCTATYQSGWNTGIQRVVRNIISREARASESGYAIQPVVCVLGNYYEIPLREIEAKPILSSFGQDGKKKMMALKSILGTGLFAEFVMSKLEWVLRRVFNFLKLVRMYFLTYRMKRRIASFEQGSLFLFADLFWSYNIKDAFDASNHGVEKVIAIIYDLIPVQYPQFVETINVVNFNKAFPSLHEICDQFICISRAVAMDLEQYLRKKGYEGRSIESFKLGCDSIRTQEICTVSDQMGAIFNSDCKVWLMVGTIEPRKNHNFVLDAFDEIWSNGGSDVLVIIGRVGWMCEELMVRIRNHHEIDRRLFLFSSVSDAELTFCYRHAQALILASHVEGFGLPLVEAMHVGLPVLCSDIPVFREIGGDFPIYFSLDDAKNLVSCISKGVVRGSVSLASWPTWDESVDEFWSKI